jgi:glucose 1-dehydrogenase
MDWKESVRVMKAMAVFPASQEIRLIDCEEPHRTQPTQIKLRMLEVGVCGTDKEICSFAFGTPPQGCEYLIIGHEAVGEVIEVGSEVSGVQLGDLVVLSVRRPCTHAECRPCRAEQHGKVSGIKNVIALDRIPHLA